MGVTCLFTCDACGGTGTGVPGDYLFPDPPLGWVWFWGAEMKATGPHACSRACWNKVSTSPDGKLYLPESHERRAENKRERAVRADLIRMDPPSAALGPVREPVRGPCAYVYFVQRGAEGPVKIGYSKNPKGRLNALQTGIPEELQMLGVLPGGKSEEQSLHEQFHDARISGEWFHPVPRLMAFIATKARVP